MSIKKAKKIRIPTLQHVARNMEGGPQEIKKALIRMVDAQPPFSYQALNGLTRDMLVFQHPYEQIVKGAERAKNALARKNFLEILPLIKDHFDGVVPNFVQEVSWRFYPVARNLMVPFQPPLFYGAGGQIFFPWFSYWRVKPLTGEKLSFFVTIISEILLQDPDLEEAKFQILDFSARDEDRELRMIEAADVPRVSETRKKEMLADFEEGVRLAELELATGRGRSEEDSDRDNLTGDLFTRDGE